MPLVDKDARDVTQSVEPLPPAVQDAIVTAVAIAVDPERTDDTVAAIPPDRLLAFIWTCEELVRRLNAAKKGAIIETQVHMEHGEMPSLHLEVAGHTFRYQQDSKNEYDDIPLLLQELANLGLKPYTLGRAVGYLRVGVLQEAVGTLPEESREIAYGLLEEHRVKKPGAWGLTDLTKAQQYRKGKR